MKRKKIASLLLVATMATSVFLTACGGTDNETGTEEGGTAAAEEVSAVGEFPITEELLELTVFTAKSSTIEDLETNLFTQELEELTNVHINWEVSTEDALEQKRNILFAGGDYPDILLGAGITQQEQMTYGEQGILLPLNDLIEEHTVELKRILEEDPTLKAAITAPDGNIYALPQINECYHCTLQQKLWINQTWLDALNLEMPTTTDEFEAVLQAFKTQDPNGNGIEDEIPLSGAISGWNTGLEDSLLNAFIYNDGTTNSYRVGVEDGEVFFAPEEEAYRDGIAWLADLYSQGLIDEAAYTQPSDQYRQVGMSEDALIGVGAAGSPSFIAQMASDRMNEYVAIPPLTGPDGVCTAAYNPVGIDAGNFAITNANQSPIASIKWIDYIYSEEGTRRAMEGREGTEWVVPEEGQLGINGEQAKWERKIRFDDIQNITWQGIAIGAVTAEYRLSELAGEVGTAEGFEKFMYDETATKYEPVVPEEYFPPVFILPDDIDTMAQLKGPLVEYVEQSAAKFITGQSDIDAEWDAYVEQLGKLKTEEYVDILQRAYEASLFYEN